MGVVGLGVYIWLIWKLVATGRRAVRVTRAGPPRDKALAVGFLGCAAGYVLMCFVANLMSQVVVGVYLAAFAACAAAIVTARDGWSDPEDEIGGDEDDEMDEMDENDEAAEVESMRVLHVNKFLHRKGGAEGYMLDLADLQRQHGHEVAFYGMDHPNNDQVSRRHRRRRTSSSTRRPTGVPAKVALAARMIWSRQAAKGMEEAIAAFRPDVVHAHNIYHQLSPSVRPRRRPARRTGRADHARLQAGLPDVQVPRQRHAVHGLHHQGSVGGRAPRVQRLPRRQRRRRARGVAAPPVRRLRRRTPVHLAEPVPRGPDDRGRHLPGPDPRAVELHRPRPRPAHR